MLEVSGVSKRYRGASRPAVDDVSLDVHHGEIFGFLGPNGAGKTTTINMVVGLLTPDTGRIVVDGKDIAADPVGVKQSIGFVPDNPDLYQRLTGMEYLNLIGDVFMVPRAQRVQRLDRLLTMFGLTDVIFDLIQSFSHGMQQKLALTSALLHEPPLLILDEPMVGLDPRAAHQFKGLMRHHTEEGNTVFFSTHILDVAERLCDRMAIIDQGRIVACGTMGELHKNREQGRGSLEELFLELTADRRDGYED